jgi:8-oxo-dGTP pyrophosphatase MutT (NUDIX family)
MENCVVSHGAFVYAKQTKRFLFLLRESGQSWAYHWGIVGGKQDNGESPIQTLRREFEEELGRCIFYSPIPIDHYNSNDGGFAFHTYLWTVEKEFTPQLNSEHCGYCWVPIDKLPRPLHHGVFNSIKEQDTVNRLQEIIKAANL